MNTLELDTQLNQMIVAGRSVDAFDRFYHEDVVAQENDAPERHGRAVWKQARERMETMLKRFNARVLSNASNGDVSFSEWEIEIELEGASPMRRVQVAVRWWEDGRVIRERFYHE